MPTVGADYWSTYFRQVRDCLRPGDCRSTGHYNRRGNYRFHFRNFVDIYIFLGRMLRRCNHSKSRPAQPHHFCFLRSTNQWQRRASKRGRREQLGFDARFKKMWEYYLTYCQVGFEAETVNVGLYKVMRPAN
jgi:cyclopropane-fatty-acyl-phospholipid synthase